MPRQVTSEKSIRVVGPTTQTTGNNAPKDIGALWARAGQTSALAGKGPTYCVYYDYESDRDGRYAVLIGQEGDQPPAPGHTAVTIPAGGYEVFSATGKIPETVWRLWDEVWNRWNSSAARSYTFDYERYIGGPSEATVDLYIGVKAAP